MQQPRQAGRPGVLHQGQRPQVSIGPGERQGQEQVGHREAANQLRRGMRKWYAPKHGPPPTQ